MTAFRVVSGVAAPLPMSNVDTDLIMPKQFLKIVDRAGLARGVFHDIRFSADGSPSPDFILNRDPYRDACFLVAGPNFGCGSSREHAVWGLSQLGIRAVVSESFGGIFFDNCMRNGLLALTLPALHVEQLLAAAAAPDSCRLTIDLENCRVSGPGFPAIHFRMDEIHRQALLAGRDHITETLSWASEIRAFEARHRQRNPWLFRTEAS